MEKIAELNVLNIPKNAVALTSEGRAYHKAAEELQTLTRRRQEVLMEYGDKVKATHAALEELVNLHTRIDKVIMELAKS